MQGKALLGWLAACGLLVTGALPVAAHTGAGPAFRGDAGPFTLNAFDGRPVPGTTDAEFRVVVQRAGRGVYDATVTVEADLLDVPRQQVGPLTATSVANVHTFRLADRGAVPWRVQLTVRDGEARGSAEFEVHGTPNGNRFTTTSDDEDSSDGLRTALIAITVGVVPAGATAVVIRRTR